MNKMIIKIMKDIKNDNFYLKKNCFYTVVSINQFDILYVIDELNRKVGLDKKFINELFTIVNF